MRWKCSKLCALFIIITTLISLYNILMTDIRRPFSRDVHHLSYPSPLKNGTSVTVHSVEEAESFMQSYNLSDLSRITLTILYENFSRRVPLFIDEKDKQLFMMNDLNRGNFEPASSSVLRGEVNVVRNGTYAMPHDCGWKSSVEFVRQPRRATQSEVVLCPLLIPDAYSFQVCMI